MSRSIRLPLPERVDVARRSGGFSHSSSLERISSMRGMAQLRAERRAGAAFGAHRDRCQKFGCHLRQVCLLTARHPSVAIFETAVGRPRTTKEER